MGLAETLWLWRAIEPDVWMLPWAWGLYGLVGAGIGLPVGLGAAVAVTVTKREGRQATLLACGAPVGFGVALLAVGAVVGRYVLNRDLFAEQGLPLPVTGALLGSLLLVGILTTVAGTWQGVSTGWVRPAIRWAGALWSMGFAALLALAIGSPMPEPDWTDGEPATAEGPSVLFVMVDTFRADHLDHPDIPTPALDALRADAVTFTDAWSAASWTRPGTASLWTSRLPSSHATQTKGARLPDEVVTWSERLRDEGLRTGALVNNINVTAGFGFDQGFDVFHYEAPDYPFGATEGVFGLALYKLLHRVNERVTGGGGPEVYYQPADGVLDDALAFVREQDGPYALFVHLMEPHDPYFEHAERDGVITSEDGYARAAHLEPDASEAADLRRRYAGEVAHLDRALADFFRTLKAEGRYDDVLIVLTADHGEEFHEHGGWWHGQTLYAEQTQVPLVVKLPGNVLGGSEATWQVRSLDVAPTLTGALGLAPDASWEGRDLLDGETRVRLGATPAPEPVPPSGTTDGGEDVPVETAPPDPAAVCRAGRRHPLDRVVVMEEDFEGNRIAAVRADGFSLHRAAPGGTRELPERALFDVVADPTERTNLLDGAPAICGAFPEDHAGTLDALLDLARSAAAQEAVEGSRVEITEAQRAQLCALGYLTGSDCP